jgi:DNA-binding transcriptional MerR regulator
VGGDGLTYTVSQVARLTGVTVRALHHYDEIGLLRPNGRTAAGYRSYGEADLDRLHRVLSYRALGFGLHGIADLLEGSRDGGQAVDHLRRQHQLLTARVAGLQRMAANLEKMMEAHEMGIRLEPDELFEVFGEDDPTRYAEEVERRWGATEAYRESRSRVTSSTREDWIRIKEEGVRAQEHLATAMREGLAPESTEAMDAAEEHRQQIDRWFYECSHQMHRGLGEMYLADPRFTRFYEQVAEGLARYVHDAIVANARRAGAPEPEGHGA